MNEEISIKRYYKNIGNYLESTFKPVKMAYIMFVHVYPKTYHPQDAAC